MQDSAELSPSVRSRLGEALLGVARGPPHDELRHHVLAVAKARQAKPYQAKPATFRQVLKNTLWSQVKIVSPLFRNTQCVRLIAKVSLTRAMLYYL